MGDAWDGEQGAAGPAAPGPRAVVVGGSLGGLYGAIALRDARWGVEVYERSAQSLRGRGGGLVLQPETEWFLKRAGVTPGQVCVALNYRQFLARDGSMRRRARAPQLMTSWDRLYHAARDAWGTPAYHHGKAVVKVESRPTPRVVFADGTTADGDLVVFADGVRSTGRRLLAAGGAAEYGGYIAWRGLVPEHELTPEVDEQLHDALTFYTPFGTQFLCYFVPGEDGSLTRGRRRLNWVWYAQIEQEQLSERLGADSERLQEEIPRGQLNRAGCDALREDAIHQLPDSLAAVVHATEHPFAQAIFDVTSPQMVYGRCCLLGDAAFTLRPHTGSGTAKAAADALTLALAARRRDLGAALEVWNRMRMKEAWSLVRHGQALAAQIGLMSPPSAVRQPD